MAKWPFKERQTSWSESLQGQYQRSLAAATDLDLEERIGHEIPPFHAVETRLSEATLEWLNERAVRGSRDELVIAPYFTESFRVAELVDEVNEWMRRQWPSWKARGRPFGWTYTVHETWRSYTPKHLNGDNNHGWQIRVVLDDETSDSPYGFANPRYDRLSMPEQREAFKSERDEMLSRGITLEPITPGQLVMVIAQHLIANEAQPKRHTARLPYQLHFIQLPVKRLDPGGKPHIAMYEENGARFGFAWMTTDLHHQFRVGRVVSIES